MLTVEEGEGGKRLDSFLGARMPEQSRSYFGGLCQLGMVLVGGKAAKKSVKVEEGQEVEVRFIISPELSLQGEDIPLDVRTSSMTWYLVEPTRCPTKTVGWSLFSRTTINRGVALAYYKFRFGRCVRTSCQVPPRITHLRRLLAQNSR